MEHPHPSHPLDFLFPFVSISKPSPASTFLLLFRFNAAGQSGCIDCFEEGNEEESLLARLGEERVYSSYAILFQIILAEDEI